MKGGNRLKSFAIIAVAIMAAATISPPVYSQDKNQTIQATQPATGPLKFYDFEELTIKVKIAEPEVLFILDKPNILIEPFEENLTFSEKIFEPLLDDTIL
jgi:hypothetical protein